MPVRDVEFWQARAATRDSAMSPCHYREYWQDRYAREMRERALREVLPPLLHKDRTTRVLDVGCGDGRLGAWVAQRFGVAVSGVDAFGWKGAYDRLTRFAVMDVEEVSKVAPKWGLFDVALLVTVLPFVQDYQRVLEELTCVTRYVVVLDNLQDPAPAWQAGLAYKRHITRSELFEATYQYDFVAMAPVNFVDRALFVRSPRALYPLVYLATRALDGAAHWAFERDWTLAWDWLGWKRVRYHAVVLENARWDAVSEQWKERKERGK